MLKCRVIKYRAESGDNFLCLFVQATLFASDIIAHIKISFFCTYTYTFYTKFLPDLLKSSLRVEGKSSYLGRSLHLHLLAAALIINTNLPVTYKSTADLRG